MPLDLVAKIDETASFLSCPQCLQSKNVSKCLHGCHCDLQGVLRNGESSTGKIGMLVRLSSFAIAYVMMCPAFTLGQAFSIWACRISWGGVWFAWPLKWIPIRCHGQALIRDLDGSGSQFVWDPFLSVSSRGAPYCDIDHSLVFAFPLLFSMLKFFIYVARKTGASLKLTVLNAKGRVEDWDPTGQAGSSKVSGVSPPMAAEVWTMVAGGGASVVYSDTVAVRPPKRDEDLTIRRLDPDGGGSKRVTKTVSPGQDYGWGNELANYGEYSGAPSTEAGKTYENRYPHEEQTQQIPSEVSWSDRWLWDVDSGFVTAGDVHLCQDHPVPDVPIQAPTRQISDHWWRTGFFLLSSLILCVLDFSRGIANFTDVAATFTGLIKAETSNKYLYTMYLHIIWMYADINKLHAQSQQKSSERPAAGLGYVCWPDKGQSSDSQFQNNHMSFSSFILKENKIQIWCRRAGPNYLEASEIRMP